VVKDAGVLKLRQEIGRRTGRDCSGLGELKSELKLISSRSNSQMRKNNVVMFVHPERERRKYLDRWTAPEEYGKNKRHFQLCNGLHK
jgi:hypothetical protein